MKKYTKQIKAAAKIFILLIIVILFISSISIPISAKEATVRVGFFHLPGFNEYDDLGNPSGYNIEYLNYIADHTGWEYEFVKANSWPEAYKMLEEHKIDLLSPGRKTPEREELFAFSEYPFGEEYGAILTLDTNYDLAYEDFSQFSKIKFGCVESLVVKDDFFKYAQENSFKPDVIYYKDTNALISALQVGEVDVIVANLMNAKKNMKVLAKFSPGSFYYMLNKDNTELLHELNQTMTHIKTIHNELESDLVNKYYKFYNSVAFTKDEINYINNTPEFTVGFISDRQPISYVDEKTGEVKGITKDIIDKIAEISGLKFKYVALPQGNIDYKYLRENNIQLASSIEHNNVNLSVSEIHVTNPYLNTQKIVVGKNPEITLNEPVKIALSTGSQTLEKVIKARYPKAEILLYDTIKDCFDAVISGRADALIQNKYAVERYLPKPKYEKLIVIPTEFIEDELSLAAIINTGVENEDDKKLSDQRLITIINKSIAGISDNEISDIIIANTISDPYKFTFFDFYDRYKYFIFALFISIVVVIIITIYNFKLKANNMKMLKLNETKLRNITNNINGGVVVLLPNKGFEIVFANEGFLSLIQYSKKEYESIQQSNYITYVHQDDIDILNSVINNEYVEEHISISLRLLRKDGAYIPTLFNGTLSISDTGQKVLYCVIMDISEQVKIMDKLEQEQARYQFLIEKSNEIIFDINIKTREISVARNFKKEFGWTLPKKLENFTVEEVGAIWFIHDDDMKIFNDSLSMLLNDNTDSECKVRIRKGDLTYRWYCVSHNIMKKNEVGMRIIGKVTDIDEEMKEKERLLRQAQVDSLTGLYNKEAFHIHGNNYFKEKNTENTAVIFLDLDNFKKVNDLLGHMVGDKAIRDAAKKLQVIFSQYDLISRFGGDEFCLLIKEIPFETLCDKLMWTVDKMKGVYKNDKDSVTVTVSAGVAFSSTNRNDLSQLMLCADKALYRAKNSGKNQFVIYNEDMEIDKIPVK